MSATTQTILKYILLFKIYIQNDGYVLLLLSFTLYLQFVIVCNYVTRMCIKLK